MPVRSEMPISRLCFHGLRKLNWILRPRRGDYLKHMATTGLDRWIEPGPIMIIAGPNAGGNSTVIPLLRALGDARLWPVLTRKNCPGDDVAGIDIEQTGYSLSARFLKHSLRAEEIQDWQTPQETLTPTHLPPHLRRSDVERVKVSLR